MDGTNNASVKLPGQKPVQSSTIITDVTGNIKPGYAEVVVVYYQPLIDLETQSILSYARDVVHRTDATASQIDRAFNALAAARTRHPCTASIVSLMGEFASHASWNCRF